MSVGHITAAATNELKRLLYRTGTRQVPTLTESSETWSGSTTFACNYEEADTSGQGDLDYQADATYDYDVWVLPSLTFNAGDRITVDGLTLKVIEAPTVGAPGPLKRLKTQRLT